MQRIRAKLKKTLGMEGTCSAMAQGYLRREGQMCYNDLCMSRKQTAFCGRLPEVSEKIEIGDEGEMKTIGVIGAMSEEIAYLKEKVEIVTTKNVIGLDFHVGKYCGNSIVLVISGIGKVNAAVCTQVLIDHFGVDYVINTGCAGAVSGELGIGDILISTDAVQHDMDVSVLGDPIGTIPRLAESYFRADEMLVKIAQEAAAESQENYKVILGRVASGDQFIGTKEGKERIRKYVQGDCAEMEGAAIAHACWLNRIPFVVIRAISDGADDEANMSYEQFVLLAAKRSSELVEKMLSKM